MPKPPTPCVVDGCDNKKHNGNQRAAKKGLCRECWEADRDERAFQRQQERELASLGEKLCSFEGCSHPLRANGLCMSHYLQQKKGKPLTPLQKRTPKHSGCSVKDCERQHFAKGLCRKHYNKMRRDV